MVLFAIDTLISTLITDFDDSNVTDIPIGERPVIRLESKEDTGGDFSHGELVLENQAYNPSYLLRYIRDNNTVILATYSIQGDETKFKEVMNEFDRILYTRTKNFTDDFVYKMEFSWDTNDQESVAQITFSLNERYESL